MSIQRTHTIVVPNVKISEQDFSKCSEIDEEFVQSLCREVTEFTNNYIRDMVKDSDNKHEAKSITGKLRNSFKSLLK